MAQTYSSIKEAGVSPTRNLIWNPSQCSSPEWSDTSWATASSFDSRCFLQLGWNVSSNNMTNGSMTQNESGITNYERVNSFRITNNNSVTLSVDSHLAYHTGFTFMDVFKQDSNFGSSLASEMQLSFWVKGSAPGTYIVELSTNTLYDNNGNPLRGGSSQSYSINSANTWEFKTVTFPALPNTYVTSNALGAGFFIVTFFMAAGTNYTSGSLNTSWTDLIVEFNNVWTGRAVGQTNMATGNNEWSIAMPQLESSPVVTPFSVAPHKSFQSVRESNIRSTNRQPWQGGIMGDFTDPVRCFIAQPFGTFNGGNLSLGEAQTNSQSFWDRTKNILDTTTFVLGSNRVYKGASGDSSSSNSVCSYITRKEMRLSTQSPGVNRSGMLALYDANSMYSGYFFDLDE